MTTVLCEAEEAVRLAQTEPRRARKAAIAVLARAGQERDGEAATVAERALGIAARVLSDLDGARSHLRCAIRLAEAGGWRRREAQARMTLALVLSYQGSNAAALREAELAARHLRGPEAAQLRMQRALVLQRMGRLQQALADYRAALRTTRRCGSRVDEAHLLINRGVLHGYRGAFSLAEGDLRRAEALYRIEGLGLGVASARHNLGFVAARRGDLPAALSLLEEARSLYVDLGLSTAVLEVDRCDVLLSARLTS